MKSIVREGLVAIRVGVNSVLVKVRSTKVNKGQMAKIEFRHK